MNKNVLIVYAHPEYKSMNGALFNRAKNTLIEQGHQVQVSDLYRMAFNANSGRHNFTTTKDPHFFKQQSEEQYATDQNGFAPGIESEIKKLEACDLMIWQFPLWWFSVPAILKGWVDRVFAMGRTYGNGRFYEKGVFRGKKAMLSLTTGGVPEAYLPDGFNGDIAGILRPLHRGILEFTGFTVLAPNIVYGPVRKTTDELEIELNQYASRLSNIWNEQPFEVGRY
jgi:NAD(P)H dehydrogenase (quinone)